MTSVTELINYIGNIILQAINYFTNLKMISPIQNKKRLLFGLANTPIDSTSVKFVYFYGKTFHDKIEYNLNDETNFTQHEKFNPTNKTVLYIFGYLETMDVESVQVIAEAYLKRHDINIIILDWGKLATGNYAFDAVPNAKQLGHKLATKFLELSNEGLDINNFHIVGHSLGGQMAGIIGRLIKKQSDGKKILKRISALDPAFPLFYFNICTSHISKSDADFVDIIHTDAWLYGAPISTGTIDFWPNSGKTLQPGCPRRNYKFLTDNDLSSHRRSWWFWAESVAQEYDDKFIAVKAKSWSDFKSNRLITSNTTTVYMGEGCPTHVTGDYYLQTNGSTPFARGHRGTTYTTPSQLEITERPQLDRSPTTSHAHIEIKQS